MGGDKGGLKASGVANKPSGVGDKEGGREAARVAENPRGYSQGVRGGVESPQGIDTPIAAELPRGYETPGVITESKRVPGYDRRGWGGDRNPPTNRATEAQGDGGSDGKKLGGLRTSPPPRPQRGTEADTNSAGTLPRHTAGTNGARPKHGALVRHEYGLLALTGTAVDPADAGDQGSGDGHEDTRGTSDQS